jgi:hypothetical protein
MKIPSQGKAQIGRGTIRFTHLARYSSQGLCLCITLMLSSCGFFTGLFGDENGASVYSVSMGYEASGLGISSGRPLIFVFFPLDDESLKLTGDSFQMAKGAIAFVEKGFVTVDLQEGNYTVAAFVDTITNGELDQGEFYEFLDDKDVVEGLRFPTALYVDASIEESMPVFFVEAPYIMPDIVVLVPASGETLSGANEEWGLEIIPSFGFIVNRNIEYIAAYVDGIWRTNAPTEGDRSYVVMMDMSPFSSSTHMLEIRGYAGSLPAVEPDPMYFIAGSPSVSFAYLKP